MCKNSANTFFSNNDPSTPRNWLKIHMNVFICHCQTFSHQKYTIYMQLGPPPPPPLFCWTPEWRKMVWFGINSPKTPLNERKPDINMFRHTIMRYWYHFHITISKSYEDRTRKNAFCTRKMIQNGLEITKPYINEFLQTSRIFWYCVHTKYQNGTDPVTKPAILCPETMQKLTKIKYK